MAARPLVVVRSFTLPGTPSDLWGIITDTEALNRAAGLARLSIEPLENASAARLLVRTRLGGFPVEYEESPFEWVKPRRFSVRRRMRKGPVHELRMAFQLEEEDGGSAVQLRLELDPRHGWMGPILELSGARGLADLERHLRHAAEAITGGATGAGPAFLGAPGGELDEQALRRAGQLLEKAVGPSLARRLTALVKSASDFDLARLRPYELADGWKRPRKEVLEACLAGVRAGLLELRWELICPSCRTAAASMTSLAELEEHGRCSLCDLGFGLDLDESVELVFSPAAAVRRVDRGPYCVGGPARTPHVLSQAVLPAGGRGELEAPAVPGRMRLFLRGGDILRLEIAADAPEQLELDAFVGAWPQTGRVAPSGRILIDNTGRPERHAKIEQSDAQRLGTPARDVTTLPAFRRDFSADLLRRDLALKVARVGLLFTDLTGSTAMYAAEGDARAFKFVQDHFRVLQGAIEQASGVVVKTIGDAVMGAFPSDLDAVRGGWAALHAFEASRKKAGDESLARIQLKLGVHAGPCYVVSANGVLDYFGQTVNVAARLQSEAEPGELVLFADLAREAVAAGVFLAASLSAPETITLKGLPGTFVIVRARPLVRTNASRRMPPEA